MSDCLACLWFLTDFYNSTEDAKLVQLYEDVGGLEFGDDDETQLDIPELFDLVLVDEAHRFDGSAVSRLNENVVRSNIKKAQRYVLLSDQSQVSEDNVEFSMHSILRPSR